MKFSGHCVLPGWRVRKFSLHLRQAPPAIWRSRPITDSAVLKTSLDRCACFPITLRTIKD